MGWGQGVEKERTKNDPSHNYSLSIIKDIICTFRLTPTSPLTRLHSNSRAHSAGWVEACQSAPTPIGQHGTVGDLDVRLGSVSHLTPALRELGKSWNIQSLFPQLITGNKNSACLSVRVAIIRWDKGRPKRLFLLLFLQHPPQLFTTQKADDWRHWWAL